MTEYWLISAPGDKTCHETWETLNNLTSKQHSLSINYKFHIPNLKVGTLDQLVGLSDDLGKLDIYVEQVTRKVATYLGEVLEGERYKLRENLMANNSDLPSYITRFQWDMAKYPIKQSLRNIADIISKQVGQIDADLKTKSTTYNNLKGSLQNLEKKQTGSLLTRNLADLVKKEHFILDSEYLTTLLVIVPRASFHDWYNGYEKLTAMIVPRSTQLITEDSEYGLFTITLFKKVIEEFKLHAREKKFIVRDFTYNEEELAAGKNEITKLVTDKKKQFGPLVRWLKVNFSECYCAWIHVKALRVFVESVLRYGLPVNFQAILLHPHRRCARRLREILNQHYAHLDFSATASAATQANQDSMEIAGLGFGQNNYFPYVYYNIDVNMVDNKVY
ncbi:V-type proton ATPase subunit Vha44 isoform X1 [Nomia melanderi]|uniref:V-type proton ATPase subunit Vha44 isoform X1 n=1 Tax=Nomia melanderi TaxID=2448451 RepID=UPI0013044630|nr:V-type proton ATPase subunit C isoform X1 [Nomia melanderi]XP_031843363.1 V-type proton ATPase subunit C isoform X1 [Nomia melanderi]XP_031843364.1 V-type proton ATPase subunit C isoform X1 [Nomia melanderi]XP_031843365.1 V-type proton ATPase subunit C isoform X1 [Nomia melanderi]